LIKGVMFSRDGQTLVVATGGGVVRVWDIVPGCEKASLRMDSEGSCVAFSPDGRLLVKGSGDSIVSVWDLRQPLVPRNQPESREPPLG
jgi:WD40 repeat protein